MEATTPKPQRKLTSLELSAPARGALRRLKRLSGMSFTHAVERGLVLLERSVVGGPPPTIATAASLLGAPTLPRRRKAKVAK